jgi:hypothetical protein
MPEMWREISARRAQRREASLGENAVFDLALVQEDLAVDSDGTTTHLSEAGYPAA